MKIRTSVLLLAFFCISNLTTFGQFSQPGELDTTFHFGKNQPYFSEPSNPAPGEGANQNVLAIHIQPDEKMLIGGNFTRYNGKNLNRIARIHGDGRIDSSFNPGMGANGPVLSFVPQPDGKMLIAGTFTGYDGALCGRIARLNPDGSLDPTFNTGTGADNAVYSIALQPDGKVIIGGWFTNFNGIPSNYIARLHPNGSYDTSFNAGTGANNIITAVVLQPDNKILIAGFFSGYNNSNRNRVARLQANGILDTTFNPNMGPNSAVNSLVLQPDGHILILGQFTNVNLISRNRIARLDANGGLDTAFNPGSGANGTVWALAIQPDSKLLIAGNFTAYNGTPRGRIARLHNNGALDSSFQVNMGPNDNLESLALQTDGKVVIGGNLILSTGIPRNFIARLHGDGTMDPSFNPATGANFYVWSLAAQANGKIIVGGNFTSFNDTDINRIARLNEDGSLDMTFNPGSGIDGTVNSIAIQTDEKVLIGGSFTNINGLPRRALGRLNPDGSVDTSFNIGTGANIGTIHTILIQPDGKIIISGGFTVFNGTARNRIARLHPNGSLDLSFNPGSGPNNLIHAVALQSDGKIVIGGNYTDFNGMPRNRIARLNGDGSLDTSFNTGTGINGGEVRCVTLQPDGKILLGGTLTSYNGIPRNRMVRLNPNGSPDLSFNLDTGIVGMSLTALQPDGKVLIGGYFITNLGMSGDRLARLNPDGSLDLTFRTDLGPNDAIFALALQPNGRLLLGGMFTRYQGFYRSYLTRVLSPNCLTNIGNNTSSSSICMGDSKNLSGTPGGIWVLASGPGIIVDSTYTASGGAGTATVYNLVGNCASQMVSFDIHPIPSVSIIQKIDTLWADSAIGTFQWYRDGLAILGATSHFYIPNQSGIYTMEFTSPNGCTGVSNQVNFVFVGIDQDKKSNHIYWTVYPVPFNEHLIIKSESPFSYQLLDSKGALKHSGIADHEHVTLLTADLASGMYLVKITTNGLSLVRKVVKE